MQVRFEAESIGSSEAEGRSEDYALLYKVDSRGGGAGGPTNRSYVINKYRTQTTTTDLNVVTSEASAANSLQPTKSMESGEMVNSPGKL